MLKLFKQGMGIQMQNNQQPQQGFNLGNFGNGGIQMTNGFGQGISHLKMYIFHLKHIGFQGFGSMFGNNGGLQMQNQNQFQGFQGLGNSFANQFGNFGGQPTQATSTTTTTQG